MNHCLKGSSLPLPTADRCRFTCRRHAGRFEYYYLGKELGGFRKGGYDSYTRTKEFELGIDSLEETASRKSSVIICAEHFPRKCHRRFISRALQKRGWVVEHIIDKGKVWVPQ